MNVDVKEIFNSWTYQHWLYANWFLYVKKYKKKKVLRKKNRII